MSSRNRTIVVVVILLTTLLVACGSQAEDVPDAPEAALAAEAHLSEMENIPRDEIAIVSYEQQEWPDACLGLPEEGEMCAQVVTPGYRIFMQAQNEDYIYRTDETGDIVRREE